MRLMVRLLLLYRPSWGWMALGVLLALLALLANVALMGTSGWFITAMGLAGATGGALDYFSPAALIRACAIARTGGRYAERLVTHEATFRLIARLRTWLFGKMEPQSPLALGRYHSGDLASRLRTDLDRLETAYLRIAIPCLVALLAALAILGWLGRFAAIFALIEAVALAFSGLIVPVCLILWSSRWSGHRVRLMVRLNEQAVDAMQGMAELLAFGAAGRFRERFAALSREAVAVQSRLARLDGVSQAGMLLGSNLALWGVMVAAIPLVRQGVLAPADLVMTALVALSAFEAVAPLPGAFQNLGAVLESARRIFVMADACPAVVPAENSTALRPDRCDLRLTGVGFTYEGSRHPAVQGLDLDVPQGRRLAVCGPTGAGKSTLILLLTGLLEPTEGTITLNGTASRTYDGEVLRACFAVAPQFPGLFCGTLADNLRLAKPDASDTEIWHVLTVVGLADFVVDLSNGLDIWLGETGLTLSGGQARRLSVARALLKDAPVVVLDEPGEGLDYTSERAMLRAVVDDLRGRSLLLITHRAAGLDLMDASISLAVG